MSRHPQLLSSWPSRREFLAGLVRHEGGGASFFHPLSPGAPLPKGAQVGGLLSVTLRFEDRGNSFHVHGLVTEVVQEGPQRGLRLEFLAEEKMRQELVLAVAAGESVPYFRRSSERVPCSLDVQVESQATGKKSMRATNISEGGIFVGPEPLLTLETVVALGVTFPHGARLTVHGRVMSKIEEGPQRGIGIAFAYESPEQRRALAEAIGKLRAATPVET